MIIEFYNSIVIGLFFGQYFGQYLVEINELLRKASGVYKINESRVIKLIMCFQAFYLIPGVILEMKQLMKREKFQSCISK